MYVQETPTGKELRAAFMGSREKAEILASMLRGWGAEVEARPIGERWCATLYSNQLLAVEHPEFKAALEAFIAKAKEKGILTGEQAERKAARLSAGPNAVEIAGVEFCVVPVWRDDEKKALKTVLILYQPADRGQFEEAVKALEELGLAKDADFAATWDDKGRGDIWLKAGAFDKAMVALKTAGLREGEDYTVKRAKGGGYIRVKNPKEDLGKALEVFKKAGLEEGRDYTVYSGQGVICLTVPEALWVIAWRAKIGDARAKAALDQLLEAAERLGIRQYFKERIRLVLMAGTKNAVGKKMTLEEKGITVEITGFKVE